MRRTNRALLAIIAGAILLITIAVGVVLVRPQPSYRSETSPADIVSNYLLALQRGDSARAYGYLSPTLRSYPPSAADFVADMAHIEGDATSTYEVRDTPMSGTRAAVTVRATTFTQGGLLSSGQSIRTFTMTLANESGVWRLVNSDDWTVWRDCWDKRGGC
ncbi:MAG: hypothetical protein WCF99_06475 [Chloroflexales bacterium]